MSNKADEGTKWFQPAWKRAKGEKSPASFNPTAPGKREGASSGHQIKKVSLNKNRKAKTEARLKGRPKYRGGGRHGESNSEK